MGSTRKSRKEARKMAPAKRSRDGAERGIC
jgi:hypothetical protein